MKILCPSELTHLELIVNSQIALAKETENFDLDQHKVRQGATAVLNDPSKGKYYLAFDEDDSFMGMLLTIPEWSDWRNATVLWIHSVYVPPVFRGQGVYKSLYQYLKNRVKSDESYAGLRLYVDKNNTDAINVYQKLNMTDEHYSLFEWLK